MMKALLEALRTLATSKRVMLALVALVVDAALMFGVELEPSVLETMLTAVNTFAIALITGISVSDHGKAMGQPSGVDHKGSAVDEDNPPPEAGD